jgi:WD40 repeat protein
MSDAANKAKASEPKQIAEVKTTRQITAARFSPDGSVLAAVGFDAPVWRWKFDGKTFAPMPDITGHHGWATAAAFHPTQPWLLTSDSWGRLRCQTFADESSKVLWEHERAHDGWLRQVAVSADGSHVATCGHDGFARVWNAADGKLVAEHKSAEDLFVITFDPTGKEIVFGNMMGRIEAWDFHAKASVRVFDGVVFHKRDRLQDIAGLRTLLFLADGKTLAASGTTPSGGGTPQSIPTILFFDYANGKLLRTFNHGAAKDGFIHDLVLHRDGYLMGVTSGIPGNGLVLLTRPEEKEPFHVNTKLPNCHALALHPGMKHFVVTSTNRNSNGNGRRLSKDGAYENNSSPLHLFELA